MRRTLAVSTVAAWLVAACGSSHPATSTTSSEPGKPSAGGAGATGPGSGSASAGAADVATPTLRLPRSFLPTGYRARLTLDPAQPTFRGQIEIAAAVSAPTRVIWLDGENLTIRTASLSAGSAPIALEPIAAPRGLVGLRAAAPIAPGDVTLRIDYEGKVEDADTYGIFHQQERGDWYAYSQFEPLAARRAFPCFDEPDNKVPWELTLEVPRDLVAVSNTPVASETAGDAGTKVVAFQKTKPLPSYLVAFGVGPFEIVDAGKSRGGTPLRIIALKGRSADAAYAARTTRTMLDALESWFGIPYPYEKLDQLAIPTTVNFGAMENAGLITYNEQLMLIPSKDVTAQRRRSWLYVATHEMAHQWFGDLVTTAWWDDIWLNEAFATWTENRVMAAIEPRWDPMLAAVEDRDRALHADGLASARQIRQPIEGDDDVESAFDAITYEKGATVIRMFEGWVGADAFQKGIRDYLTKHAWGNATAADFLAAIGGAADRDVATPFNTFLTQVGAPEVSFDLRCAAGAPPVLAVRQERNLPLGSTAKSAAAWQLPLCVAWDDGGKRASQCTLLTDAQSELPLAAKGCPRWVVPNVGGTGYYRSLLSPSLTAGLDKAWSVLTPVERLALTQDVTGFAAAGRGDLPGALAVAARAARERPHQTVGRAAKLLSELSDSVPPALTDAWAVHIRAVFGASARRLGWLPRKGDSDDDQMVRADVVPLVAYHGRDDKLGAEAVRLAWKWIDDHDLVPASIRGPLLEAAVRRDGAKLFERLEALLRTEPDRRTRSQIATALGSAIDPELVRRALALTLDESLDIRDVDGVLWAPLADPATRPLAWEFVREHADALVKRFPRQAVPTLATVGTGQCAAASRDDVAGFATAHFRDFPGGVRSVAQDIEKLDLCIVRRAALAPALEAFLGRKR